MTEHKRIAIDTSKSVFTPHGIQARAMLRTDLCRGQMNSSFKKLAATEIVLEACGGSHHWARELTAFGHRTILDQPQYVKPHVKRGNNDRNDAEAIREAAGPRACISFR